ncbi:uncharacterized protein B0P05DRAFT_541272 [Gilbertella persicaria]|uniref:uncharacterized protein n=1 Tax=Gilbertella persicaria TaxID=101096 RepID=UPI002220E9BD|nr:uncharacterized protein B0P05DRAFT_541272 [Gilbertella persicaria]KAI8079596.1 hypothetical protein B0P05DRAFT_541272 [Gilbertella persicaria]
MALLIEAFVLEEHGNNCEHTRIYIYFTVIVCFTVCVLKTLLVAIIKSQSTITISV